MARLLTIALVAGLLLAGCGDSDDSAPQPGPSESGSANSEPDKAPQEQNNDAGTQQPGTEIALGESQFGPVLFDGDGQAIYYFDAEESERPECYGECAAAWPPVLTKGEPRAAEGVLQAKLGTTRRDDGSEQVTYDGHPLYLYAHEGPDVVTCHDVAEFGGLWLAVQASGARVA